MLFWGVILFSPVLFFQLDKVQPSAWLYIIPSALFEAMYFFSITKAYHTSDLSIVYPLARGTAPVFLLSWTILFMGEKPSPGGISGIFIIALGLYVINLPRLGDWKAPILALTHSGPRWAILSGFCISIYTAIDKIGIGFAPPLIFTYITLWITWIMLTPHTLYSLGWTELKTELKESKLNSVLAGFTTTFAFVIVLYVMQLGGLTSYVGAVREISVVLGAIVGIFFLKEKGSPMRVLGAGFVAMGVITIKFMG